MNNVRIPTIVAAAIGICLALAIVNGTRDFLRWRTETQQQQEQFAADLAHEKKVREEEIAATRFEKQTLAKERAERIVEAENNFKSEQHSLKWERSQLLDDIDADIRTRTRFQERLEALLTNELGQRISASPAAIGHFHQLHIDNKHAMDDLQALKDSVPPESAIIVDAEAKTIEAAAFSRDIEFLRMQLKAVPSVHHTQALVWSLEGNARRLEPREPLRDALARWKDLPEVEQHLNDWTEKDIDAGLEFYGRYNFTRSNPQKKDPVGFFRLAIENRNGIYFDASLQLGKKKWPVAGQVGKGKLTFKAYRTDSDREYNLGPFVTYTGELKDRGLGEFILSGTFELATRRTNGGVVIHPGSGNFYAQTVEDSLVTHKPTKSPLLSGRNDRYAPGAIWTGHYQKRLPKASSAQTEFSMKILSRVGDTFTAVLLPDKISLFNGKLGSSDHRKTNLTWSSAAENGNLIEYTATDVGGMFVVGEATGTADGVLYRTTFRMQFARIDEDFWDDELVWPSSETARSDATAAYQR